MGVPYHAEKPTIVTQYISYLLRTHIALNV